MFFTEKKCNLKMPRKKSKKRKNKLVSDRTKPTTGQSKIELVSDLPRLNNNVSSFVTDDEILLESLKKEEADRHKDQNSVSSDAKGVSVPVKKRVELESRGKVLKHFKYWGSKFERKHDTISLDKFFIRKTLRNSKRKKSRRPRAIYIKSEDDDDEISFKVTKHHLDRINQEKTKDEVESQEIDAENSLKDLKDVIDEFFPTENFDLKLEDLDDLFSVKKSQLNEETKLEDTAFDLLEVSFHTEL